MNLTNILIHTYFLKYSPKRFASSKLLHHNKHTPYTYVGYFIKNEKNWSSGTTLMSNRDASAKHPVQNSRATPQFYVFF